MCESCATIYYNNFGLAVGSILWVYVEGYPMFWNVCSLSQKVKLEIFSFNTLQTSWSLNKLVSYYCGARVRITVYLNLFKAFVCIWWAKKIPFPLPKNVILARLWMDWNQNPSYQTTMVFAIHDSTNWYFNWIWKPKNFKCQIFDSMPKCARRRDFRHGG